MGLYSERDNWLQTGAAPDSADIRYTENKFIFITISSRCDGDIFYEWEMNIFDNRIPLENNRSSDYEVAFVCNGSNGDWNEQFYS